MDWYYAEAGQQHGPVTEAEFNGLVQAGTIRDDTLVWRDGMANWQAYGEAKAGTGPAPSTGPVPPDAVVCSSCGGMFGRDDLIKFGESWVCASCKPAFVQRLREGVALPGATEYAGFWIRFAAKFVDGIILRIAGAAIGMAMGAVLSGLLVSNRGAAMGILYGIGFIVDILYRTLFVGAFGATPGKMAAKIRIVNADGSKVSYLKALARCFAEWLSLLTLFVGYIMVVFDPEKRALHDRICGTRVIKVRS